MMIKSHDSINALTLEDGIDVNQNKGQSKTLYNNILFYYSFFCYIL